jgi:UDP-glucose 4-epimerase
MKILFTGASSFTGYWFVRELAQAGHAVVAIFRGSKENYTGLRRRRVDQLIQVCQPLFECEFGSETFLKVINEGSPWDLLCHHAADVANYKSPLFNPVAALENNTKNIQNVLEALRKKQCERVVLTGSVFEQNEGVGSDTRAFSPYGLSKGLTFECFKYYCEILGLKLGKFVIPNPFGPFEDPRFTSYLMQNWRQGKIPEVNTPEYIRDNIHVSLLAKAYLYFVQKKSSTFEKINPSQYCEKQGAFAQRFSQEMSQRLNIPCPVQLNVQKDFLEPLCRINTDASAALNLNWSEKQAWDELAEYYTAS